MARQRTYRHDIRCPQCGSNWMRKYGHVRGKQSYSCGDCGRRTLEGASYRRPSAEVKEQAIQMYAEGSSLSAIGRVLGYSVTAVQKWVKKGGSQALRHLRERGKRRMSGVIGNKEAVVVSYDEMWTYSQVRVGEKREDVWIWSAVVEERNGFRWVDFEVGGRDEATFLRLFERLPDAQVYRSDAYRVYGWLPRNRHKVGKGSEVNRNEGLHSVWRGKLNRLMRRTKGYTKSIEMLVYSLALVCWRQWLKSIITTR